MKDIIQLQHQIMLLSTLVSFDLVQQLGWLHHSLVWLSGMLKSKAGVTQGIKILVLPILTSEALERNHLPTDTRLQQQQQTAGRPGPVRGA